MVRNARDALVESGAREKQLTIQTESAGEDLVRISVSDNGVGIAPENRTRIFSFGFTTKKDGHGFGLHSSALAAKELGGSLTACSDGPGKGSRFTVEVSTEPGKGGQGRHE